MVIALKTEKSPEYILHKRQKKLCHKGFNCVIDFDSCTGIKVSRHSIDW
jgi:hypothetical protein